VYIIGGKARGELIVYNLHHGHSMEGALAFYEIDDFK
jgi:hypothetical protein